MYTISALAKKAALPRRTVQYWHDRDVIRPINSTPVVYDDKELVLVRVLSSFAHMSPSLSFMQQMARIVRLGIDGDESVPVQTSKAFVAAKKGQEAYLAFSPSTFSNAEDTWVWTLGATDHLDLLSGLKDWMKVRPELAAVVVNLTYCYRTDFTSGALYFEDN